MQTYQVGLIALALAALGISFAYISWKRNRSNQESSLSEPIWIEDSELSEFSGFYVATTFGGQPLKRVTAYGLGARGRVQIALKQRGIELLRTGEKSFLIPWKQLKSVGTSTAVIDRAVEGNGLISLNWSLGDESVETHLRIVDGKSRENLLNQLSERVR